MSSLAINMVIVPGVVALLLFLVFTYLYEQSRKSYFRAWQLGWGAYSLHFALQAWAFWGGPASILFLLGSLLLVWMAMCIFISTRLMGEPFRRRWYDFAIALALVGLAIWNFVSSAA